MGLNQLEEDEVYFRKEKMGTHLKTEAVQYWVFQTKLALIPNCSTGRRVIFSQIVSYWTVTT